MSLRTTISLGAAVAMLLQAGVASAADAETYVEFLWSRPADGALARQETQGFVLDGRQHHQVCVAVLSSKANIKSLQIDTVDAADKVVSRQVHDDFRGKKKCYEAGLNQHGIPGEWTFRIYLDGAPAGSKTIQVAKDLPSAPFYNQPSLIPYVLGRPIADDTIDPKKFIGRLVWVMYVNANGAVAKVEVEAAEGVGIQMKDRAIAAGYLSLFPPDPARNGKATYRRELAFAPDPD